MIYYVKPMHLLDAMSYLGYKEGDFPIAEEAASTVLSLPFHPYMVTSDQEQIITTIKEPIS
jgi:UDP-2-acetamido-2-deoxy-ribo-hexuluronate aminotransferase